jgi:hypothetical protein
MGDEDMTAIAEMKPRKRRRVTAEERRKRERLKLYLMQEWQVEEHTAKSFARKHANYPFEIITTSITNLIRYFENLHISHYGYRANNRIIHSALNHTLRRFARSKTPLSDKQLSYFLQLARDEEASRVTSHYDPGTMKEREKVLNPLKQALFYENDEAMKKRLLFIYGLFVKKGIRLTKNLVIKSCTNDKKLFPHRRVVEDALETLRGAYEALGFLEGELFITPEYMIRQN